MMERVDEQREPAAQDRTAHCQTASGLTPAPRLAHTWKFIPLCMQLSSPLTALPLDQLNLREDAFCTAAAIVGVRPLTPPGSTATFCLAAPILNALVME